MSLLDKLPIVLISYVALLFSLCVHEASHASVAYLLKDDTAKRMGRMTLNPIAHISLVGTVIFPLLGLYTGWPIIGWAKPVPVDARNLAMKSKRLAYSLVSAAGPASNLVLTLLFLPIAALMARSLGGAAPQMREAIFNAGLTADLDALHGFGLAPAQVVAMALAGTLVWINLLLAFFNMLPFGPLDGAGVIRGFLPWRWLPKFDRAQPVMGIVILVAALTGLLGYILGPMLAAASFVLSPIANFILGG